MGPINFGLKLCVLKTVKTNDKIRRFGVVMTPFLKKKISQIMQITAFKSDFGTKNYTQGYEDCENAFARITV